PPAPKPEARIGAILADLRQADRTELATQLDDQIRRATQSAKSVQGGHVAVGRVVIDDGRADPRTVAAQMEILDDGWVATAVRNVAQPVAFRLHGYEPLNFLLSDVGTDPLVFAGEVRMKPLEPAHRATCFGRVVLQHSDPRTIEVELAIAREAANTPTG